MADNKRKVGSPDSKRINVHEPYELRDWAKKFGVTTAAVQEAVKEVGTSATAVQQYLSAKKR